MSRSNQTENAPNPAAKFFEWNGEKGTVRYYDKDAKTNVDVPLPFTFLLLDELGSVRGWHDASSSGIYSNEVRDTRQDVLIVKAFKGGTLAEGLYKDIKAEVGIAGGQFVANCYIAFKQNDELVIGSLRFKGAALGAWMEFRKANRSQLYKKAVEIHGYTEGKKGRVIFRVPEMRLKEMTAETNNIALGLDQELQAFLSGYLKRTKVDQVDSVPAHHVRDEDMSGGADDERTYDDAGVTPHEDSIPFGWLLPLVAPLLGLGMLA
jgi:hypothetical protein